MYIYIYLFSSNIALVHFCCQGNWTPSLSEVEGIAGSSMQSFGVVKLQRLSIGFCSESFSLGFFWVGVPWSGTFSGG